MIDEPAPPESRKTERLIYNLREVCARQFVQPNDGLRILTKTIHLELSDEEKRLPPDALAIVTKMRLAAFEARNSAQILYDDIGIECVPALIDHIDDDTLTRSVDYWRDSAFSHKVLTVGECCRQILDRLVPPARIFDFKNDPEETKTAMKNYYSQRARQIQKLAEPSVARSSGGRFTLHNQSTPGTP